MCNVIIPHTAVFSIRTEVCGTAMQNSGTRTTNTTDEQFVPNCNYNLTDYGHVTTIREQPLHINRAVVVAIPGWWISSNSWSNIREWDDLSSVVSARVIGWCQPNCMPSISIYMHVWWSGTESILFHTVKTSGLFQHWHTRVIWLSLQMTCYTYVKLKVCRFDPLLAGHFGTCY